MPPAVITCTGCVYAHLNIFISEMIGCITKIIELNSSISFHLSRVSYQITGLSSEERLQNPNRFPLAELAL